MLILERPWTRQIPSGVVPAKELFVGSSLLGKFVTNDGQTLGAINSVLSPGPGGTGYTTAANGGLTRGRIRGSTIGSGHGAAVLIQFSTVSTTLGANLGGLGSDSGGPGDTVFAISLGTTNAANARVIVGNINGSYAFDVAGTTINDGRVHTAIVSLAAFGASAANVCAWIDGKDFGVVGNTGAGTGNSYLYQWVCANTVRRTTDLTGAAAATVYAVIPFFKHLSPAEGSAYSANPWQLFQPRRIYIPTAAAAGYTHPTLSLATATEIGTTSFKPSVTYTFA